ncbi:putative heme/steroid binding protein [Clostridium beijerinckii]|uniref:cytochrome b5 domain-containing protein n=1 Tax=Clostridium beijerinckii TaxID=1520 RepID=UPI001F4BD261|nr:cytochrome b5 domain-containing protein [Clostridium beijerinckii]NSA97365.1 putative heme/steroid binding protein [Clostridium beijerinckii]
MSIYFDLKTINELTGSNSYRQPKELTLDDLSQYDGRGGKPAYVAIEGVVYDVSNESNWSGGTHYGLNAGQDLTDQFNSCHGMMQILNNAPKVGILVDDSNMSNMNFDINENMKRQVKQNTSNFRPDDWIRYVEPIVSYSLSDNNQGTGLQGAGARRSYQKAILLGVLVGLGRTPQEAITQVQQWQNTGATTLLGGPSTGGTTSGGTGTGGTTGGGMGTGGTTGSGIGTGGTTGGGIGTGGTTRRWHGNRRNNRRWHGNRRNNRRWHGNRRNNRRWHGNRRNNRRWHGNRRNNRRWHGNRRNNRRWHGNWRNNRRRRRNWRHH